MTSAGRLFHTFATAAEYLIEYVLCVCGMIPAAAAAADGDASDVTVTSPCLAR